MLELCRYDAFVRGLGERLKVPYWKGPPIPGFNLTHDALVRAWRIEHRLSAATTMGS